MYKIVNRVFLIWLLVTLYIWGASADKKLIILNDLNTLQEAKAFSKEAYNIIASDTLLSKMDIPKNKMPRVLKVDSDYLIVFGPFVDNKRLAILYFRTKRLFKDAILISLASHQDNQKEVVYKSIDVSKEEDWTLWIAMFALALVGILALFFSSLQINRIIKQNRIIRQRQEEMERRQHELFSKMGENIYTMSKHVIENTKKVISDIGDDKAPKELKDMVITENRILDTTNNLLEFLKIKAKKIKIEHKKFKINNMLDDVVGAFVGKYPHRDLELVLDIEHTLPIYAVGDFTNIVNILRNLLEHQFSVMESGEVVLYVSMNKDEQDNLELYLKITPYGEVTEEVTSEEDYFIPDSVNEQGIYKKLDLFVAYELVSLMEGDISAKKLLHGGVSIELSIPVEGVKEDRRKYRLPSKKYTQKRVYITNRHYHASLAQKNLFEYFRHEVTVEKAEKFISEKPNLSDYDIVLVDSELIYQGFDTYVQLLRQKYGVKVVCMENILQTNQNSIYCSIFNKSVKKPLNQEHVFLLILSLYSKEIKDEFGEESKSKYFKREFLANVEERAGVKIDDLERFSGARVLVVEDNEINQRMISTVLHRAGIELDIASNGEEAIEILKEKGPKYYDIVLMDINMPIMDGFTATKKIREMKGMQDLPIVSLTALVLEHEIEKMKEAGMDAFLPKPINIGKLYTIFKKFIGEKGGHKEHKNHTDIKHLDGLDIEAGLKMSGGNVIFYQELLKEFLDVYKDSGKAAKTLYKQQRLEAIKQLMLDIMGLSGTIGAKDLHKAANEVYKLYLYNKLSLLPSFLDKYEKEMERVNRAIEKYLQMQQ